MKGVNILINTLNNDIKNIKDKINNILHNNIIENINTNYIIAEIEIKEEDVNKNIRIINSHEEWMRTYGLSDRIKKKL